MAKAILFKTDRRNTVIGASSDVAQTLDGYQAYGHARLEAGHPPSPRFNGELLEPHIVSYLLGSYRLYNPLLQRFVRPDALSPFGAGGINAYAYCLGDPVNYSDSTGKLPQWADLVLAVAVPMFVAGGAAAWRAVATARQMKQTREKFMLVSRLLNAERKVSLLAGENSLLKATNAELQRQLSKAKLSERVAIASENARNRSHGLENLFHRSEVEHLNNRIAKLESRLSVPPAVPERPPSTLGPNSQLRRAY